MLETLAVRENLHVIPQLGKGIANPGKHLNNLHEEFTKFPGNLSHLNGQSKFFKRAVLSRYTCSTIRMLPQRGLKARENVFEYTSKANPNASIEVMSG